MKNLYVMIALVAVVFCLSVSSLIFYDQWQEAKRQLAESKIDIKIKEKEIEALNSNREQDLNKVASKFVTELFTYNPEQGSKAFERVSKLVTGKAKVKLNEKPQEDTDGYFGAIQKDITSAVEVTDAQYNKTGNESAAVVVKFEQVITLDGSTAKTLNEMKVQLKYIQGRWKVEDYELKQIL